MKLDLTFTSITINRLGCCPYNPIPLVSRMVLLKRKQGRCVHGGGSCPPFSQGSPPRQRALRWVHSKSRRCLYDICTDMFSLAFGSTYAREQAFEDEQWRARLCRPDARTFIAREREQDPSILSSISLIGPNAVSTQLKSQLGLTGRVLSWELNGVFTLPAARRRGIAAAVITAAKKHALKEAVCKSSACLLTVVVYTDDRAAKSWYEKMGFKVYQESQDQGRPTSALAMLQQGL